MTHDQTTPLDPLDASAIDAIATLVAATIPQPPTADELRACLFAPDQPTIVRGDPAIGVVVSVPVPDGEHEGFVRLLAVDPEHQRQGHGRALLRAAERDLLGDRTEPVTVTIGADAPYYLFAGVETDQTGMLYLLEREHYGRHEANFNMLVDLRELDPAPHGPTIATPGEREEVDAWMEQHWSNWRAEVLRALDKGTLMIERDAAGISAFCAWDVNRAGLLGPVAVRPDLMGKGAGAAVLLAALHRIHSTGCDSVEVSWIGPVVPYVRVGGRVNRVFFVYKKTLRPRSPQ